MSREKILEMEQRLVAVCKGQQRIRERMEKNPRRNLAYRLHHLEREAAAIVRRLCMQPTAAELEM